MTEKDKIYLQVMNGFEVSVVRIILISIKDSEKKLDLNNLVDFLYGKPSEYILKNNLEQMRMFSSLHFFSKRNIKKFILSMKQKQLLKSNGNNFRSTFCLSEKAHDYWINPDNSLNILEDLDNDELLKELNKTEILLFKKLKSYRALTAINLSIPAYIICINLTLVDICKTKPRDLNGLLLIKGTGEKFIERYGKGFQKILDKFYEENNI